MDPSLLVLSPLHEGIKMSGNIAAFAYKCVKRDSEKLRFLFLSHVVLLMQIFYQISKIFTQKYVLGVSEQF